MLKQIILKSIKLYQKTLSVDHGFFSFLNKLFFIGCRFQPTCSEYAYQAIEKYGVLKGTLLSAKRVLRCHPFSKGGWDPVE